MPWIDKRKFFMMCLTLLGWYLLVATEVLLRLLYASLPKTYVGILSLWHLSIHSIDS